MGDEAFSALPNYSESKKPQLDLESAIKIGEGFCAEGNPDAGVRLAEACFKQPADEEKWCGVFFYFLRFEIALEGKESYIYDVLVLPTGSVLEPQEFDLNERPHPGITVKIGAEEDGARRSATAVDSKSEAEEKPEPESKRRSQ